MADVNRYPPWSRPGKVAYDPPTQYVYTSLIKPSLQIRLLRLHPAPKTYNSVRCTLVAFTLDEIPEYEALSYLWGDPGEHGHEIFVDQSPFVVRPNLGNAMKRMRDESQGRWIWIDAICINMDDLAERNAQISLMRTIFSKASQVIVWLGEPSPRDLPAIETLKHPELFIKRLSLAPILRARSAWMPNPLKQTELYTRNLDHLWFTRVWTVQEYVLAQKVVFQWGSTILDSIALTDNVNCIVNEISSFTRIEQQQEVGTIMNHLRGFRYFSWVKRKWDKNAEDITTFAQVVATAQELYATDPRDKVFGLLALAPSSLRGSYRPDYASTVDDVYLRFALAMSLTTRVKAVVDSIEQIDLSDGDTVVPDWLPGWIDELSLRVSDLLREPTLITGSIQSAVVECLEIVAINERPRFKGVHISSSERYKYAESLRNASDALRSVLSQVTSTEVATLTTLTKSAAAPSTLHSVANDFSDSGYSSASSSAENTYLVANEIASHLVSHSYLRRLLSAAQKLEDRDDVLERYIRPCIRHLGQQLDTMASDFEELLVAKELKRHAPFIARALIARLRGFDIDEDQDIKIQRVSRIQRLLDEEASKLQSRLPSRLHEISTDENPRSARYPYGTDSSDGTGPPLQNDLPKTALEKVKEFLTTESAFMSFLYSIQYVVYRSPLEIIESEVEHLIRLKKAARMLLIRLKAPAPRTTLREKSSSYDFKVPLNNEAFAFEGHAKYERFRHSLSISGNGKHCYATSCETYLKWAWPGTSHYLLNALSRERSPESSGHLGERNPKIEFSADSSIDSEISVTIDIVNNEKKVLIEIAQQLAWLTAACRRPVFGELTLSDILFFVTDEGTLQISTLPVKEVVRHDEACWRPLFSGSVIAHRWPIPDRGNEIGIELPFHLMTALVGPLYPMKFDGGFCLKVHSRILFPTAVSSGESRRVQWHYESKPDARVTPPWYQKDEGDWDQIKRLETRRIVEARTFLGFYRKAVVDLGTEKSPQYYKNILYSGLEDEDHSLAVGVPTSITLGTGSLLPMTLTASVPIIRNKAQLQASDLERDYIDILDEAQERPVILYDTNCTSRGWMVPLSCVLLHMVHTWSAKKATFAEEYPQIGLTSNSGVAARNVLLDKWSFVVRKTINTELQEDKLVRDLVIQFWKDICQKQFQDLLAMSQEDYSYELQTEKLFGWEYMDVVDGKNSRRKQLAFKTNWGMFREQCIILFSQNLGDVILPADDVRICGKWRNVPTKRMHLTATVRCLTTLAYQNGGERDTLTTFRLTNKGYWHYMPKELFLDCEDSEQHTCLKKLQFLHSTPPESSPRLVPPSEGAVVFGRRKLEKLGPPVVTSPDIGVQSNRRSHRFNLVARTRERIRTRFERVASDSTTTPSSHEASDPLLSSGDISDDS